MVQSAGHTSRRPLPILRTRLRPSFVPRRQHFEGFDGNSRWRVAVSMRRVKRLRRWRVTARHTSLCNAQREQHLRPQRGGPFILPSLFGHDPRHESSRSAIGPTRH